MADPSDYEGYDDLVELGRSLAPDDRERFAPPADLWQKIERAAAADDATVTSIADRPPAQTRPARRRPRRLWVAAVAAGVAACLVVGIVIARDGGGSRTLEDVALSNAGLDPAGASTS